MSSLTALLWMVMMWHGQISVPPPCDAWWQTDTGKQFLKNSPGSGFGVCLPEGPISIIVPKGWNIEITCMTIDESSKSVKVGNCPVSTTYAAPIFPGCSITTVPDGGVIIR